MLYTCTAAGKALRMQLCTAARTPNLPTNIVERTRTQRITNTTIIIIIIAIIIFIITTIIIVFCLRRNLFSQTPVCVCIYTYIYIYIHISARQPSQTRST